MSTHLPLDVAQGFADLLDGRELNGYVSEQTVPPPWRAGFREIMAAAGDYEERRAVLAAFLIREHLTDKEIADAWRDIAARRPGGKPEKDGPRIEVLTRADLRSRPRPVPLIEGHLQQKSLACLYGPSGHGKSFVALSFTGSVCLGRPWFGHAVEQGGVVYIAAEGDDDMDNRLSAWEREYNGGRMIENLVVIPHSLDLRATSTPSALMDAIRHAMPSNLKMVVVDTLARNMSGDENSTEHMGQLVRQCDVIWQETGCLVLLVHHTGKNGEQERGNSSMRAATNTMMKLVRDEQNRTLKLTCDKQKNAKDFAPWTFVLKEIGMGVDDRGNPVSSCVLDLAAGQGHVQQLPPIQRKILDVLAWSMHSGGIGSGRLRDVLGIREDTGRTAMYAAINRLHTLKLITVSGEARSQIYAITDLGRDMIIAAERAERTQEKNPDVF